MLELATLAQVKGLLRLTDVDATRDIALQEWVTAANSYVAWVTGLSLEERVITEELHPNARIGSIIRTRARPIDGAVVVEGRWHGDSQWVVLGGDVLDAAGGYVRLIDGPGSSISRPYMFDDPLVGARRWRARRWPMLRLAYTAAASLDLSDLSVAAATLAIHWNRLDAEGMGRLTAATVGQIQEQYADSPASAASVLAVPASVTLILSRFRPFRARLAG